MNRLLQAGAFGNRAKPLDVAEFLRTIDRAVGDEDAKAVDGP